MKGKITRRNLKSGLVGFIDLLGFSNRVQEITTVDELRQLDDDVVFVQTQLGHKPREAVIKDSNTISGKSVLAFSDCLVVTVSVDSKLALHEGTFDVFMSELNSIALAQGDCVTRGIFLRGGIEFGDWFRRKDTLISPALVSAYNLESEDVCVPMIAISPKLRTYLANHPHRGFYSQDYDPIPVTLREYRSLPNGKPQKALWFINYLRLYLGAIEPSIVGDELKRYKSENAAGRDRIRNEAWKKACRKYARLHADAISKAYAATEDQRVRAKYRWLAKYHNDEIKRFFRQDSKTLRVKLR